MVEELKIIMETLGNVTGEVKMLGVYWLTIRLVQILAFAAGFGGFLYGLYALLSKFMHGVSRCHTIRDIIFPSSAYGEVTDDEWARVIKFVRRHVGND